MTTEAQPEFRDRIKRMTTVKLVDIVDFGGGNPVDRTKEDVALLDTSLEVNGYIMPVEVRELPGNKYETIDGHGRISRIRAKWPDVTEIKVLVLDVGSVEEGRQIMLGLRNSARWDMDELDEWMRDGLRAGMDLDNAMALSGLTAADLDSLAEAGQEILDRPPPRIEAGDDDDDEPAASSAGPTSTMVVEVDIPDELPKKTVAKPGDVWKLGDSRLVCGDSTVPENVRAALGGADPDLLWTDPPWNVAIDAGNKPTGRSSTRKERTTIQNDALGKDFAPFAARFTAAFAAACPAGTPIYVAMSCDEWGLLHDQLKLAGFHWSSTIIWAKNSLILSRKDFHPQYEPIWYGWKEGAPRKCAPTDRAVSDLWYMDRPRKSDLHPTMKPVALVARSINASSKPGDLVLDTFGGSGTTLLAAEQMGRRASLVELDPAYVDVIVERWQRLTGKKATKSRA